MTWKRKCPYNTGWPILWLRYWGEGRPYDTDWPGVTWTGEYPYNTGWPRLALRYYDSDIGVKATRIIRIGRRWPGKGSVRTIQVGHDCAVGTMTQILGWRPPVSYGLARGDLEREVRTIQVGPYYDSDIGVKAARIIRIGQGWPGKGSVRTIQVGQDWPIGTMTQILGWRPPVWYGLAGVDLEIILPNIESILSVSLT